MRRAEVLDRLDLDGLDVVRLALEGGLEQQRPRALEQPRQLRRVVGRRPPRAAVRVEP